RTGHSARTHIGRSSPGARFVEAPAAGLLEITARNCRLAAAGAWLERIPGVALLTLPMPENAIDDSRIGDERDYLHLGATAAQERVHLEGAFFILHLLQWM